jgi:hypothetical protein
MHIAHRLSGFFKSLLPSRKPRPAPTPTVLVPGQPPALPWNHISFFVWQGPPAFQSDGTPIGMTAVMFALDNRHPKSVKKAHRVLKKTKDCGMLQEALRRQKLDHLLVNAMSCTHSNAVIPACQSWDKDTETGGWYQSHRAYYVQGVPCPGPINPKTGGYEESNAHFLSTGKKITSVWVTPKGEDLVSIDYAVVAGSLKKPFKERLTFSFGENVPFLPKSLSNLNIDYLPETQQATRVFKKIGDKDYCDVTGLKAEEALADMGRVMLMYQNTVHRLAASNDPVSEKDDTKPLPGIALAIMRWRKNVPRPSQL